METFELILEQERYLKKVLFELVFDDELNILHQQPTVHQVVSNTLLLKQLYQFLMEFPLFGPAEHQKFKTVLSQTIQNLPHLTSTSTGATKRDFKLQLRSLLVHCSMFLFIGPKEQKHYQNTTQSPAPQGGTSPTIPISDHHQLHVHPSHHQSFMHSYNPHNENNALCTVRASPTESPKTNRGKAVFDTMQRILLQYQAHHKHNMTAALFDVVRDTEHISQLPDIFKELMMFMRKDATDWAFEKLCTVPGGCDLKENQNLGKLKRIHTLLPQTVILGILKIANPFALTQGFVNLCVARPFGVKNLMQRVMESLVRLNETEHEIERTKKMLSHRKKVVKKLSVYFSKHSNHTSLVQFVASIHKDRTNAPLGAPSEEPLQLTQDQMRRIGELIAGVLQNMEFKPRLKPQHMLVLTEIDYQIMWRWMELESRRKAKTLFIDFIGSDVAVSVFKDLIPMLYMPLMSLYDASDLEMLVRATFTLMEGCIKVAEGGILHHLHPKQQLFGYGDLFDHFSDTVYRFVHHVANVDSKHGDCKLEALVKWSLQLYTFNKKGGLSVENILRDMPATTRDGVVKELQAVIEHREKRKQLKLDIKDCKLAGTANHVNPNGVTKLKALEDELKRLQPPSMVMIHELLPAFTDAIQNHFKQAGVAQH